jgi:hypothetical protein
VCEKANTSLVLRSKIFQYFKEEDLKQLENKYESFGSNAIRPKFYVYVPIVTTEILTNL